MILALDNIVDNAIILSAHAHRGQLLFRLRHKLEPDPRHPTYIRKASGDGYRLITQ